MFTYRYHQPDEYHFSLDSIYFARFVADILQARDDLEALRVLDLCAGCGVVGLELSWHVRQLRFIDFVEIQDIYTHYFYQNVDMVNRSELQLRWHLLNYDVLLEQHWENKFDLIVSNPPYFQSHQSMLSPSLIKNRCRFFLDSSFKNYLLALANSLTLGGQAYFLMRTTDQYGCDLITDIKSILEKKSISISKLSDIRGTSVILLEKYF